MTGPILITGGGGMLAQALARSLQQRNTDFTALTRAQLDFADSLALMDALGRYKPALLLNCAAHTKVDLCEHQEEAANAINGDAVGILAMAAKRHGTQIVHFSTDYVFDGTLRRPLRPDDPVGPQSAYGRSKLLGEQLLRQHNPPRWLIIRTAWLYGAGGPNFVQTMVNAARAGKALKVVNDQLGTPTYTIDLADAALDLIDSGATGIWHVTNSGQTTWFDFAAAIFEEFGLAPSLARISSAQWRADRPDSAIRPAYSVLDVEPLARQLGRPMRHWREALRAFKSEWPPAAATR